MKKLYKTKVLALCIAFICAFTGALRAQLPIDCNKFYLHDLGGGIHSFNPATSTSIPNAISTPAAGNGLAVSNNLNAAFPAMTFYTTVGGQYQYYNGSGWTNTGHNCSSAAAVNLCGAGPYIYNLDGLGSAVYRYNGLGNDVLVLNLTNWSGPYDLIGDDNGNFYVLYTNAGFQKLVKYSPTGAVLCTYTLIGLPNSISGGGYAIIGNKLYMSGGAGDFVGTIVGNTITFTGMVLPLAPGDFGSCPFPQLTSGINTTGNLSCSTLASVLSATTSVTGPSYNWSGPGIVSGGGTSAVTVNQPGVYTVVITGSGGACPGASTSTVAISQSGIPPVVTASGSGAVTCASSAVNLSCAQGGMTYTWTAPGGSSVTSGVNSQNATGSGGGTYTVIVRDPLGGCVSTAVVTIASNTTPPTGVAASAGGVLTCATTNVNLSGSPGSGVNYSWTGPGIVSGNTTANPTVNQPGTYNLTVTDPSNGCTANTSVVVSQNVTAPAATAAAGSGGALNCLVTSLSLSGSPSSGVSYSWSGPGIVSGGNTANPVVNQPGSYNLVVTNTSNGCSNSSTPAFVSVTQNIAPPVGTAAAGSGGMLNCNVTSLSLSGTPGSGVSYSWSGPGIVSGGTTANPVVNQPGTYNLVVTNTTNGCSNAGSPASVLVSQNNTAPAASAATGNTVTCAAQAVNLSSSPAGMAYNWTAPGGSSITSGANAQNATANGGGTYTVTVTNTANGCTANALVVVPQNITPPAGVSAASGGTLSCSVANVTLSGTPGSGVTYSWSGPGIVSGGNTANPVVNQPGNYNLTVTNISNGCSNTTPAVANVVQNGVIPPATVAATGPITCTSPSLSLVGSTSSGSTYSWSGPGIISGGSSSTAVVSLAGIYVYSVTNTINGCSNSTTITITQNTGAPSPSITASGNGTLTCLNTSLTLTGTPGSGLSYSWSGPGIVSGGSTANPVINQPGTYSLTTTNTVNGCANATPVVISVSQNTTAPVVNISTAAGGGSITCAVSSVTLNASPGSGVSYSWTGPGIVSGSNTATPVVNQAGNYSVTVTDIVTGCSNINGSAGAVINVPTNTVVPLALINAATSGTITCISTVVSIDASASASGPSIIYSWMSASGPMGGNTSTPSISTAGDYTLTVFDSINGCSNTASITIVSNLAYPGGVSAGANTLLPCNNKAIILNGSSFSANISYSWQGPGGYSHSGQSAPGVDEAGTYTLIVTDNITGCKSTSVVQVTQQSVIAAFTPDQTGGMAPLPVNFTNTSVNGNTYSWSFGDGNTATTFNTSNTFQNGGTYTVVLTVFNASGTCSDTATAIIIMDDDLSLEIPNVFTPNDDNINDLFTIKAKGVKEISLQIFNRWGEKLYEFTGAKAAWDGMTGNGGLVPDATYFYFVKATGFNDTVIEKNGTVNLFR
jgi:gliding motility-associated-like protein